MGIAKNVFLRKGVGKTLQGLPYSQTGEQNRIDTGVSLTSSGRNSISFFFTKATDVNTNPRFTSNYCIISQLSTTETLAVVYFGTHNFANFINPSGFTHICLQTDFDEEKFYLYKDGVFFSNKDFTKSALTSNVWIYSNSATRAARTNICFFNIYDRFLSDNEIKLLSKGYQISKVGLLGRWNMTEGSGTTLYDSSGNGNHLTTSHHIWTTDKPF